MYKRIGTKFKRKYGKKMISLIKELKISIGTLSRWDREGFDIYKKQRI